MAKIIVDYRERTSGIVTELAKENEIELKQLISADFIIDGNNKNQEKQLIGIERKTKEDFLNSIIDKRIITQLNILREHFSHPILIIEGTENLYQMRNFHPNAIRGMLAAIAIDFQVPILYTRNYKDTAKLITVIAKRLEKPKKLSSLLTQKKPFTLKEQQELLVSSFPGIGPETSKLLLKNFKSVKNLMNADEKQLKEVDKIGPKKALQILQVIESIYLEEKL